jgi:hypothetical protein
MLAVRGRSLKERSANAIVTPFVSANALESTACEPTASLTV